MTRNEAEGVIKKFVHILGHGFHPQSFLRDYSNVDHTPCFHEDEVDDLQKELDDACEVLGEDVYWLSYRFTPHVELGSYQVAKNFDMSNRIYYTKNDEWSTDRSQAKCYLENDADKTAEGFKDENIGVVMWWN